MLTSSCNSCRCGKRTILPWPSATTNTNGASHVSTHARTHTRARARAVSKSVCVTALDGSTLPNGNEQLVFHGCAADAIPSILAHGFQRKFWKSAAGDWQRFGPGFYFALQVSETAS